MPVHHKFNDKVLFEILRGKNGAVAKDLLKRGLRVETRAKLNLGGGVTGPKRIDTGALRADIRTELISLPGGLAVRVGSSKYYALWVHNGTGLYGPRHQLIYPKSRRVLVFHSKVYGAKTGKHAGKVFTTYSRGMKPNPYLKEALPFFKI